MSTRCEAPPTTLPDPVDHARLSSLFRAHYGFVWRTVHRLGVPPASADDAVQDVFVVLHRRRVELEISQSPRALLFGIARRVAKAHRDKNARPPLRLLSGAGALETPEDDVARWEAAQLVRTFLDELDEAKRMVFILAELEGMAAPEIAEALGGINVNTVYTRLRAARKRFARAVKRHRARERGSR